MIDSTQSMVAVPREYIGTGVPMACRVTGDCMRPAGIDSGDMVVVDCAPTWDDGDVVMAKWGDGYVIKRAYQYLGHVILRPDAAGYMPLMATATDVIGRVTAVRKPSGQFHQPLPGPSRHQIASQLSYWRWDNHTGALVKEYDRC